MPWFIFWLALVLFSPWVLGTLWLLVLTLLSAPLPRWSGRNNTRFAVLVPAHNEAACIERTLRSLKALDYPPEHRQIWVVADNCTDNTAALARAQGVNVLERFHKEERGKGYALRHGYQHLLEQGWLQAVVVIDADTEVSPNLLSAFAARLYPDSGQGTSALQAFYGVLNPLGSWRTRLMTTALAIIHRLRGRGRERLGVSAGLKGNGMCFTAETLRQCPHQAFSLAEDLEYAVHLAQHGIRVQYVDEAEVRGEMVSNAEAAASQRQRWEGGRALLRQQYGYPLLKQALQQKSALLLDLALDVLVPPLGTLVALMGVLALIGVGLMLAGLPAGVLLVLPILILIGHVLRGVSLSGLGAQGWQDLALAPFYVLWKLSLKLRSKIPTDWVRTAREKP
jgi:cellulose synthase/poly-beta-1,6-N-acetylglucosamine synthase-like glycosyltransferase